MPILTIESTRFLKELQRRRDSFKPVSARLSVPPDLKWWYWQEYGTAISGEPGKASGRTYKIKPINYAYLKFPDPEGVYGSHEGLDKGDGYARRFFVKAHPGVKPTHMIRSVLDEIEQLAKFDIVSALVRGNYETEAVRQHLLSFTMEQVKSIIVRSISQNLLGYRPDGRLGSKTAAQDFEQRAFIK
jgi:hypothetical protein